MRGPWASLAVASSFVSSLFNHVSATSNLAERAENNTAATFFYTPDSSNPIGNFTFTISANAANGDLWWRMSAPAEYSWLAVGTGSEMQSSTMWLVYEGSKDNSITVSGRKSTGNVEPSFWKDLDLNVAAPSPDDPHQNGINDGIFFAAGTCQNCTTKSGLSTTNKMQPFIFAVGPQGKAPRSDSPSAPLRRHAFYGHFSLDMTQAQGKSLPALGNKAVGVTQQAQVTHDHERASSGHAFVMALAFAIIFPAGIFMLRVLNKVKFHMYFQSFGLLLVLIGFISGMFMSKTYNRSKNYNNPHQVIGIIVFLLILATWVLGFLHHRTYVRTGQTTWMIKPHKWGLGPLVIALGIINAALGFKFALANMFNLVFVPIVIIVLIFLMGSVAIKRFFANRKKKNGIGSMPFDGPAPTYDTPSYNDGGNSYGASGGGYGGGYDSGRSDIALNNMGAPPSYSQQPAKPRELI